MNTLLTPFWNPTQHRLRAVWRILLQGLMLVLLAGFLPYLVVGLPFFAANSGQINLSDPNLLNEMLNQYISAHPWLNLLAQVTSSVALVLAVWMGGRWLDRRRFTDFGLHFNRRWWVDLGFGLFLGAILMLLIFLVEWAAGWITITDTLHSSNPPTFWRGMFFQLIMFIGVGIGEEMISRGYHLRNIAEGLHWGPISARAALLIGYIGSSALFGLFHLGNDNATWVSTFNIAIAGLFLGLGYVLTGELAIPIGLHITWNFFQGAVFGFPVSGGAPGVSLIAIQQGGSEIWTGGAFGPEAGLIGLLAILLGCGLTILWVRWRDGQVAVCDALAVYEDQQLAIGVQEPATSA